MTDERLNEIKAMWVGATPGPWARRDQPHYTEIVTKAIPWRNQVALVGAGGDADFIASAPEVIPELIDEVKRLKREMEAAVRELTDVCVHIEAVEGGKSYCAFYDRACDSCESEWRGAQEGAECWKD